MKFSAWGLSDVGRKRDHNEDSYLVRPELGLFAVADGMGGHQAGEQASRMALEVLERELVENPPTPRKRESGAPSSPDNPAAVALKQAAQRAGAFIFDAAQSDAALHGMGTTLTALLIARERAYLAHVGDSRCYLFRDGKCIQLTEDHSWVNEQVRAGLMKKEDAKDSRFKHIITRSVGFERAVQVDGNTVAVAPGDCFLLCSDGLSNYIEGEELGRLMASSFYRQLPQLLVQLANDRGGDDNVTVVLIHAANDAEP